MRALVLGRGKSGAAAGKVLEAEGYEVTFAEGYDRVVVSPGIPVSSELQVGVERLKAAGVKLLAVTGSKGKSSVVKLLADALQSAGFAAVPCGNYGLPVCDVPTTCDWAVVEVSSFQLETTVLPPDAFEAAAILNLQEDHLDRHGSVAVYHALKKRLLKMAKVAFDRVADPGADELLKGSYFDNAILRPNGRLAAALLKVAGLQGGQIRAAFTSFVPLPHRMEKLGVFGGVTCIDDSKATSLAALAAGVEMTGSSVRLIAGGLPKGDDPNSVTDLLTARVKKVYLIGQCAETFFAAWSRAVPCAVCGTMDRAVKEAMREAEEGDEILLSPGAASFDQFKSYGERGEIFATLVKKEGQNRK